MKTSLDHLPVTKRRELERVRQILFEEFESALANGTSTLKKRGRIVKIILFGSFARGGWVDDRVSGYKSDYDILVIVNNEKLTDFDIWNPAEDRILHDPGIRTPVQFIVETKSRVNNELANGQYFFTDIKNDGIALYELKGHRLAEPKNLTPEEYHVLATEHFENRLPYGREFAISTQEARQRGKKVSLA